MKVLKCMAVVTIFLLTSCNSPLNKKYNEDTAKVDLKEILDSEKADTTDVQYMAMYVVRAKMLGESLESKTYNDILDNAKELRKKAEKEEAATKKLADKVAKEENEKRAMFAKILTVALFDKGYVKADYQSYLTYSIAFENKGSKDIRAIKGSLAITDLFDTEIKKLNLVQDEGVLAGKTFKDIYTTDYNQYMDDDTRLNSKELKDVKAVWTPEKIIFSDGTVLE